MNIKDILKNIEGGIFKNKNKIDLARKIISESINFEIKESEITFSGDSINLKIHPTIKHEIKIKKAKIIERLKKNNIFISNII